MHVQKIKTHSYNSTYIKKQNIISTPEIPFMLPSSNYFPFPQGQPLSQLLTAQIFFVCFCSLYKWKHIVCTILIIEIKFTYVIPSHFLKCTIRQFLVQLQSCTSITTINFLYSGYPQRNPVPISSHSLFLPIPHQLQATTILLWSP